MIFYLPVFAPEFSVFIFILFHLLLFVKVKITFISFCVRRFASPSIVTISIIPIMSNLRCIDSKAQFHVFLMCLYLHHIKIDLSAIVFVLGMV